MYTRLDYCRTGCMLLLCMDTDLVPLHSYLHRSVHKMWCMEWVTTATADQVRVTAAKHEMESMAMVDLIGPECCRQVCLLRAALAPNCFMM